MVRYSLIIFSLAFLICVIASVVINLIYGYDIVYTHLFYIPIILAGLWYPRLAVIVAAILGAVHITCDYISIKTFQAGPFLRTVMFISVAYVISHLTMERNRYYNELEMLNNAMLDMITKVKTDGKIEYISPSVKNLLGYAPEELIGKDFFDLVHPDETEKIKDSFQKAVETMAPCVVEHRLLSSSGEYIWIESMGNPILDNKDGINIYVFGSRDITLRKKAEEELKYLSIHDALTGLYNRFMFEEELNRLKTGRFDPVGIIICDIDGLKIINDNLGHSAGDKLLIKSAEILKEQCRTSDILARIGGDEFAILIQECTERKLENVCSRIKKAFAERNISETDTRLFISIGCAMGNAKDFSIDEILKEADENMYQEKAKNRKDVLDALGELIRESKRQV
ncbi:MAG: diguanylate cyclase [Syntrophorhabdaceae bacterium]|nr:diguanylate cyclase [Syntrophorhabdaceae bacterium]